MDSEELGLEQLHRSIRMRNLKLYFTKTSTIKNLNIFLLGLASMLLLAGIQNRSIPTLIMDSAKNKNSGQCTYNSRVRPRFFDQV
jgi:hypothetical protein